jgi:peptide chain release factor 1
MFDKLDKMMGRRQELQDLVSDAAVIRDQKRYRELMQELSGLEELAEAYGTYKKLQADVEGARELVRQGGDSELVALAKDELKELKDREESLTQQLKLLLIPKDPLDLKNIIMEIRGGTGGEEAALFAADLFRMYSRFAEGRRWSIEILSSHATEIGGMKEIVFSVSGKSVYENLRYESGVHRVQRVPVTEAGGRIHTSTVTVAVLPEVEQTEIDIRPEDLRVDVFRSSGPGGQSVNTTDSAVRITHLPTGLVVTCQDEKSQHKNKAKALRVLRARLYEAEEEKKHAERAQARRLQVGSGDRSERIRTYNFPQNRLTDHRIGLTLYNLDRIILGDLDPVIETLKLSAREEYLKKLAV